MISQNRKTAEKKGHSQGNGPPFLSRETPADRRLHSAGHFAGTQAAGAGVHTLGSPVDNSLHTLDVGLPSPVRTTVGVRDLDAERHILTAEITFCHICTSLQETRFFQNYNGRNYSRFPRKMQVIFSKDCLFFKSRV